MMTLVQLPLKFDGNTYNADRDEARLGRQLQAVKDFMLSHEWVTVSDLKRAGIAGTDASLSARIRDLRKEQFGSYTVDRKYIANGLYAFRVRP